MPDAPNADWPDLLHSVRKWCGTDIQPQETAVPGAPYSALAKAIQEARDNSQSSAEATLAKLVMEQSMF